MRNQRITEPPFFKGLSKFYGWKIGGKSSDFEMKFGGFSGTLFHSILGGKFSGKLRDFEINLFLETFPLSTYVVMVMYLLMVIIRSIAQHNYRYHVLLGSNKVDSGASCMGGGGLEPCPTVAHHGWTDGLVWWVGGPGAFHSKPGGLGWGPWVGGQPPLMPACTRGA